MSRKEETAAETPQAERRCPHCDSVVPRGAERCIMCGAALPPEVSAPDPEPRPEPQEEVEPTAVPPTAESESPTAAEPTSEQQPRRQLFPAYARGRRSSAVFWITAVVTILLLGVGALFLRERGPQISAALVPTPPPLLPTASFTPTASPQPTDTPPPTETPTQTPTAAPTDTPQPPRVHSVASGETLYGLSLLYRISAASIAAENNMAADAPLQVGQNLAIPWPTATPPLESVVLQVNEETAIADVTDCQMYALEPGDSVYGLAAKFNIPAEAIIAVNRLTDETIQYLQPGDTFCIPQVVFSDQLPPTPGPTLTPSLTPFPAGPELLYPVAEAVIDPPEEGVSLQWVAVKDLAPDEWYMVELTDMDVLDGLPYRDFTRDTSFTVPADWRPVVSGSEAHRLRWRVSIVKVTGQRSDGAFIYTFGGRSSEDAFFTWLGATPTPTPTPTPLPTATPLPTPTTE